MASAVSELHVWLLFFSPCATKTCSCEQPLPQALRFQSLGPSARRSAAPQGQLLHLVALKTKKLPFGMGLGPGLAAPGGGDTLNNKGVTLGSRGCSPAGFLLYFSTSQSTSLLGSRQKGSLNMRTGTRNMSLLEPSACAVLEPSKFHSGTSARQERHGGGSEVGKRFTQGLCQVLLTQFQDGAPEGL